MTEQLEHFDKEQGGETFINVNAQTALPLVRAGKNFRDITHSGVSASTIEETLKNNEIGTLDG